MTKRSAIRTAYALYRLIKAQTPPPSEDLRVQIKYRQSSKRLIIAEFAPSGYCDKCKRGGWDGTECNCDEDPNRVKVKWHHNPEMYWVCPHCDEEIGEKGLFHDVEKDSWHHRGPECHEKPIVIPNGKGQFKDDPDYEEAHFGFISAGPADLPDPDLGQAPETQTPAEPGKPTLPGKEPDGPNQKDKQPPEGGIKPGELGDTGTLVSNALTSYLKEYSDDIAQYMLGEIEKSVTELAEEADRSGENLDESSWQMMVQKFMTKIQSELAKGMF